MVVAQVDWGLQMVVEWVVLVAVVLVGTLVMEGRERVTAQQQV
tara:strand:+ start:536 stop:664 length:129 start_codon:yes stop_codon:yes gene_type:complete